MNLKSILVAGAATVAGVAGGVAVYQITAPAELSRRPPPPAAAATPKARAAKGETRFAPCRPPAVLEGGKCVTTAVQTVTLPAPAAAAGAGTSGSPPGSCAGSPQGSGPRTGSSGHLPRPPAPAPAAPAHQPASQPAGESEDHEDEDSDCRKLRERDYDDAEEKAELEDDCAEDKAEAAGGRRRRPRRRQFRQPTAPAVAREDRLTVQPAASGRVTSTVVPPS